MLHRHLTADEVAEAYLVFGPGLDYRRAFVAEDARWPDFVDRIGAKIQKRMRTKEDHNAITLGNTSYFPVRLRTGAEFVAAGKLRDMGWLIHELTHQWQYQRQGWSYFTSALRVQLREGRRSYDYRREHPSDEAALLAAFSAGRRLASFNPEQQGDLAGDYYVRCKLNQDCGPWDPFIAEFR
jgi:hypothetical protein